MEKITKNNVYEMNKGCIREIDKSLSSRMKCKLQKDIQENKYVIFLQPKANLRKRKGNLYQIDSAEALVRYTKNDKIIGPGSFVPLFEECQIISLLDFYVFEEVCKLLNRWNEEKKTLLRISFNFSKITLMQKDVLEHMERIRKKYKVERKYLEVEITETMKDLEVVEEISNKIVNIGYCLTLDDFGAGYSNLYVLSRISLHYLKLDKKIIENMRDNEKMIYVVEQIIEICHELAIQVVAEGIEGKKQLDILSALNCDYYQGYYLNKPIPIEMFQSIYMDEKETKNIIKATV